MSNEKIKYFLEYFIIFLIVPIVGTLIHEFGHYIVAVSFGYEARIAYAYTISSIPRDFSSPIYFYYILGGPLTTWIQSVIPFLVMIYYYNKERRGQITEDLPNFYKFLLSFTAVCGRFIFNAGGFMITHSENLDEAKMAAYLGIFPEILVYPFAIIAFGILIYSIYMLPKHLRVPIFFSAIFGALVGYGLWYYVLGPVILPVNPY